MQQREGWSSGHGFVLATIGAAVGLGNIWRFSYVAGENGGGAFLIVYLLSVLLVGAPLVVAEMALGRHGAGDAIEAFEQAAPGSRWRWAGLVGVVGSCVILSFYAVIAGWALKYLVGAATGALWEAAAEGYGGYFNRFIANPGEPVAWQLAMLVSAMFVVGGGVQKGIEALNRLLMPLLGAFVVALAVYVSTFPGAAAGWRFLFYPDWSMLLRGEVLIAALGQAFFSLGVGMAVFITYASYMTVQSKLPIAATAVIVGDTLFAVVAGLAIFPAVFAFSMEPDAGPNLAFITLPQIFLVMPAGVYIGVLFFGLLSLAALTSMISLLEVPVASLIHQLGWRRWRAVLILGIAIFVAGIPMALSFGVLAEFKLMGYRLLDFADRLASNYLLPAAGMLVALFVGWRWSAKEAVAASGLGGRIGRSWLWLLRLLVPLMIVAILLDSVGSV